MHSYRYAWAERAKTCGYPERFAQEALGHNSKAVHRAYSKNAQVTLPPLEDYEKRAATAALISFIPVLGPVVALVLSVANAAGGLDSVTNTIASFYGWVGGLFGGGAGAGGGGGGCSN